MKNTKKLLALALAFIMCLGVVPMSAFAVTTIDTIAITGVTPIALGKSPNFGWSVPSNAGYTKHTIVNNSISAWAESNTKPTKAEDLGGPSFHFSSSGTFVAKSDKYYTFVAYVKPSDSNYVFSNNVSATINGNEAWVVKGSGDFLLVYYCFGKPERTIATLNIHSVTAPVVGETASFDWYVPGSAGYTKDSSSLVGDCVWVETDTAPTTYVDLESGVKHLKSEGDFTFESNKFYTFVAFLTVSESHYSFSNNLTPTLNSDATAEVELTAEKACVVWYCFGKSDSAIDTIEITGVTAPIVGATASFDCNLPEDANYDRYEGFESYVWFETDTMPETLEDVYSGKLHQEAEGGFTFEADKYYTFYAALKPDSGYAFSSELSATLNDSSAMVESTPSDAGVWYCFGKPAYITGIRVESAPWTREYKYKTDVSYDGFKVVADYSNGAVVDITADAKVTNYSAYNKKGDHRATVKYGEFETSFDYSVKYTFFQWVIIIILFGWIWY